MLLFEYRDDEGDRIRFETRDLPYDGQPRLALRVPEEESELRYARGVDIPRSQVLSLIQALSEWAYPVHTPEAPNRSLIEQMIEKAVKDQISAVLPLHLSPVGVSVHGVQACRNSGCWCTQDDPEPGDVGHPRPAEHRPQDCPGAGECPEAEPQLCKGCAKGSHPHVYAECSHCDCKWTKRGDTEPKHGRLMANLPRRTRTAPSCLDCLHGWGEHMGGICWGGGQGPGLGPDVCDCTRERPGTP